MGGGGGGGGGRGSAASYLVYVLCLIWKRSIFAAYREAAAGIKASATMTTPGRDAAVVARQCRSSTRAGPTARERPTLQHFSEPLLCAHDVSAIAGSIPAPSPWPPGAVSPIFVCIRLIQPHPARKRCRSASCSSVSCARDRGERLSRDVTPITMILSVQGRTADTHDCRHDVRADSWKVGRARTMNGASPMQLRRAGLALVLVSHRRDSIFGFPAQPTWLTVTADLFPLLLHAPVVGRYYKTMIHGCAANQRQPGNQRPLHPQISTTHRADLGGVRNLKRICTDTAGPSAVSSCARWHATTSKRYPSPFTTVQTTQMIEISKTPAEALWPSGVANTVFRIFLPGYPRACPVGQLSLSSTTSWLLWLEACEGYSHSQPSPRFTPPTTLAPPALNAAIRLCYTIPYLPGIHLTVGAASLPNHQLRPHDKRPFDPYPNPGSQPCAA
ncbi:hypothetical protein BU26DRAFT_74369 [Trematosphaeria pertusa]|uniref:Uncharacterized protein n=1 Tax=Trematosphaeria pertusa TaxID=390896 RepID=A0A6A6I661_9PLEO|nr:uncharacterized protein BU26DRAFT_74369 [Trematosphaeria pertusa]KAF2245719.1 hypothetical protein BU26DRAFT_74369 [Trematosphaeria pertusa]